MHMLSRLHWPLIVGMGALALLRPLLQITGVIDRLGTPLGPLLVTALISAAWLLIVVLARIPSPLLTLACTGIVYGLFALAVGAILASRLAATPAGPLASPSAVAGVLATHALWGVTVGIAARALQREPPSGDADRGA